MKKLLQIILLALATIFTSCEKYETPESAPSNYHSGNGSNNSNDTLKYNLDWSSQLLGITLQDIKPTSVKPLMNAENGGSVSGEFVSFNLPEKSILIEFYYEYGIGITGGSGRINGHTFILNVKDSKINFCNYYKNVSVVYDLFSSNNDIDN